MIPDRRLSTKVGELNFLVLGQAFVRPLILCPSPHYCGDLGRRYDESSATSSESCARFKISNLDVCCGFIPLERIEEEEAEMLDGRCEAEQSRKVALCLNARTLRSSSSFIFAWKPLSKRNAGLVKHL